MVERYVHDAHGRTFALNSGGCRRTDIDCDGLVGAIDLVLVRNAFANPAPSGAREDLCGPGPGNDTPDGIIDDADLACVRADLGLGVSGLYNDAPPAPPTDGYPRPLRTFSLHGLTYDRATGLVFARARYYHPELGRWTRRDPKGYVDGGNLYEAFRSNHARYVDPMGTASFDHDSLLRTIRNDYPLLHYQLDMLDLHVHLKDNATTEQVPRRTIFSDLGPDKRTISKPGHIRVGGATIEFTRSDSEAAVIGRINAEVARVFATLDAGALTLLRQHASESRNRSERLAFLVAAVERSANSSIRVGRKHHRLGGGFEYVGEQVLLDQLAWAERELFAEIEAANTGAGLDLNDPEYVYLIERLKNDGVFQTRHAHAHHRYANTIEALRILAAAGPAATKTGGTIRRSANYTQRSRTHVFTHGHAANSPYQLHKSRFYPTEGGSKFTDEVLNHPNVFIVRQGNGRIRYEVSDLGRTVGTNKAGIPTRGGTVVVEGPNPHPKSKYVPDEVVTQYPR
jgi:RHS repeat-associated protein